MDVFFLAMCGQWRGNSIWEFYTKFHCLLSSILALLTLHPSSKMSGHNPQRPVEKKGLYCCLMFIKQADFTWIRTTGEGHTLPSHLPRINNIDSCLTHHWCRSKEPFSVISFAIVKWDAFEKLSCILHAKNADWKSATKSSNYMWFIVFKYYLTCWKLISLSMRAF